MESKINELIISSHCHSTEDLNKVKKAILNIIPLELRYELSSKLKIETVHGFYGNEIRILTLKISGEKTLMILKHISSTLSDIDKSIIRASLDLRYDSKSNKLYLRFNKQQAYRNRLTIDDSDDVIKVVVSFRGKHKLNDVKNILREMGLI